MVREFLNKEGLRSDRNAGRPYRLMSWYEKELDETMTHNVYPAYDIACRGFCKQGNRDIARQITGIEGVPHLIFDALFNLECAGGTDTIMALIVNRARHDIRYVPANFLRMVLSVKMNENNFFF